MPTIAATKTKQKYRTRASSARIALVAVPVGSAPESFVVDLPAGALLAAYSAIHISHVFQ